MEKESKKKNIIHLTIGFIGAMLGCLGVNMFNTYVLMLLPLSGRMIGMILIYWLIALVPIILMICNKEKLSKVGFLKENIVTQIGVGIVIAFVMSVVFTLVPHWCGFGDWVDNGKRYHYLWQFIYEFVYCIVAVGAVEEFVFRGYLYEKAKVVFNNEWCAIAVSSVMFGLLHIFSGNIIQVCMTMLLGMMWCVLRLKVKHCSILSLILAHGIYDALITLWASIFLM